MYKYQGIGNTSNVVKLTKHIVYLDFDSKNEETYIE